VHNTTSTRSRKDPDHLSQRLKPLSKSSSALKGTARGLVGFSRLELSDNCCNKEFFARKKFGVKSCWLLAGGGMDIGAILH